MIRIFIQLVDSFFVEIQCIGCIVNHMNMAYTYTYNYIICNRSTDYGRTFVNETDKFPTDAVAHWYYISKDNNKVCSIQKYAIYLL